MSGDLTLKGALAGLKPLGLLDRKHYTKALALGGQLCSTYYFPFLLALDRSPRNTLLWTEEAGSLCLFVLVGERDPVLHLYAPPIPMNGEALRRSLERANDYNGERTARIYWIDEQDVVPVQEFAGLRVRPKLPEYLYRPGEYGDLGGGAFRTLRRNVSRVRVLPGLDVRPYASDDAAACLALLEEWERVQGVKHDTLRDRGYTRACIELAPTFPEEVQRGEVILIDGRIRAFAFGGELRPGVGAFFVAKSDPSVYGLSYFQRHHFLTGTPTYPLVNDSSDMGSDGLRQLKRSLRPWAMHAVYGAVQVASHAAFPRPHSAGRQGEAESAGSRTRSTTKGGPVPQEEGTETMGNEQNAVRVGGQLSAGLPLALRHADPRHYVAPEAHLPDYRPQPGDDAFLQLLEGVIRKGGGEEVIDRQFAETTFPQRFERLVLMLYAPGHKRIVVSRGGGDRPPRFSVVMARLRAHPRFGELAAGAFRLQMDFVVEPPAPLDYFKVGMSQRGERHFEIGLDGLMLHGPDGRLHLFSPGDAYVRSIMGMGQLRDYLAGVHGDDYLRASRFERFRSESYVSASDGWRRLYRGHPLVGALTREKVEHAVELAVDHIQRTQDGEGRFLYYYDAARDSRWDHEHPKRHPDRNPFYNILRHGGGGLTCIYFEKYMRRGSTHENIRRAIEYLIAQTRIQEYEGREGGYIYHEKKAKLGGSGIALYLMAEYQLLTGDDRYRVWADRLAWHLINQVTASGEFIYYNVYLDKPVGEAENQNYFSFYYPGEAVCGLAKYLHLVEEEAHEPFFVRLRKALEFLIVVRPQTRADQYTAVPSDSWLMMGIMELWDFPAMRDPLYADFVFSDATVMIDQLYKVTDAPCPDYAGAFHYQWGDFPYADGARCEGLLGAYELALKMGEEAKAGQIWRALRLAGWAVMHLVNSADSIYCAPNPELALGGIRFKYTRQWFRIDTIQHVASFYAKLLPHWEREEGA